MTRSGATDDLVDVTEYREHVFDWITGLYQDQVVEALFALIPQCDAETLHAAFGANLEALGYAITEPLKRQQSLAPDGDLEPEYDKAEVEDDRD